MLRNSMSTGMHCGDNYEIKLFHSTQYVGHIRNFVGRLINTLVNTLNSEQLLPRAIVIVLDDDLIWYINIDRFGMSVVYGRILHYIFSEFHKLIVAKKDFLRMKSKRHHFPELLWIDPPFHNAFNNNSKRHKFSKALDNTAAIYIDNWSLKLKRIWDPQSTDLFLQDVQRYTSKGLMTYWMAVDRTIKFWDTALSPVNKMQTATKHPGQKQHTKKRGHADKFYWQRKREF